MFEPVVVSVAKPEPDNWDARDGAVSRQALATVALLQQAARDGVTVMIPGEWRRSPKPHPQDIKGVT
jgi:hypothetical protein